MYKNVKIAAGLFFSAVLFISCSDKKQSSQAQTSLNKKQQTTFRFDRESASHFAEPALRCIKKEYPNKLSHVMNDETEVKSPRELHPAFYGCFDWHSCVHGHWMLVRLLKMFPDLPQAREIRKAIDGNLTAQNILIEVEYLHQRNRKSFERTYGWSWLLKLADELYTWNDPDGKRWSKNLQPLADAVVVRYLEFLPKQTYPIRRGVHPNTAFGISFALDYARTTDNAKLEKLLTDRATAYYFKDTDYPAKLEPDGDDFLSPSLIEADLMRRILTGKDFAGWFHQFLPNLVNGEPQTLLQPANVSDRSDPKIVHLDGLNLSRAWCMYGIASSLPENDPARPILLRSAKKHAEATLPFITSGNYEGEHWLASFAIYMLTIRGR